MSLRISSGPATVPTSLAVNAPAGTTGPVLDVAVGGAPVFQAGAQLGGRIAGTVQEGVKDLAVYFGVGPNGDSSRVVFAHPAGSPNWEIDNVGPEYGNAGMRFFANGAGFPHTTALILRSDSGRAEFANPIQMDAPNQTAAPGAGAAAALPATPAGYVQVYIGTTAQWVPFY